MRGLTDLERRVMVEAAQPWTPRTIAEQEADSLTLEEMACSDLLIVRGLIEEVERTIVEGDDTLVFATNELTSLGKLALHLDALARNALSS